MMTHPPFWEVLHETCREWHRPEDSGKFPGEESQVWTVKNGCVLVESSVGHTTFWRGRHKILISVALTVTKDEQIIY